MNKSSETLRFPHESSNHRILYGHGISHEGEIIELGVTHKFINKSGAWYACNGEKIGQGKDNAREYLKEHPEIAQEIEARIRAAVGGNNPTAAAESEVEA